MGHEDEFWFTKGSTSTTLNDGFMWKSSNDVGYIYREGTEWQITTRDYILSHLQDKNSLPQSGDFHVQKLSPSTSIGNTVIVYIECIGTFLLFYFKL